MNVLMNKMAMQFLKIAKQHVISFALISVKTYLQLFKINKQIKMSKSKHQKLKEQGKQLNMNLKQQNTEKRGQESHFGNFWYRYLNIKLSIFSNKLQRYLLENEIKHPHPQVAERIITHQHSQSIQANTFDPFPSIVLQSQQAHLQNHNPKPSGMLTYKDMEL